MKHNKIIFLITGLILLLSSIIVVLDIGLIEFSTQEFEFNTFDPSIFGFFGLIFFIVFSTLYLTKEETIACVASLFVVILWEIFAEFVGWYFNLWDFAFEETNPFNVLKEGLYLGVLMGTGWLIVSIIYIILLRKNTNKAWIGIVVVFFVVCTIGWCADMNLGYDTPVLTYIVWIGLNMLHLMSIIQVLHNDIK